MSTLFDSLFSGTFNDIFTGETYASMMSVQAHFIGLLGLIGSLVLTLALAFRSGGEFQPYLLGWTARAIFCLCNTYFFTFNMDGFEEWAHALSIYPVSEILSDVSNSSSYTAFCALVYKVFGRNPLLLQDINICLWALILHCVPKITSLFGSPRAARPALWICAVLPSGIFYSTVILRESVCTIWIVYGAYYWLRATKRFNLGDYFLCVVCFGLASLVHYGCIVLLMALVVITIFGARKEAAFSPMKKLWFVCGIGGFSLLLGLVLFRYGLLDSLAPKFSQENLSLEAVGGENLSLDDLARTDYMSGLRSNSLAGLSWTAPIRFLLFLFTPLPWMVKKIIDLMAFADAMVFVWIFIVIFRARKWIIHDRLMLGMLLCCLIGMFVFAMGTVNFGTAVRHRAKFFPIVVALAFSAREIARARREQRRGLQGAPSGRFSRPVFSARP